MNRLRVVWVDEENQIVRGSDGRLYRPTVMLRLWYITTNRYVLQQFCKEVDSDKGEWLQIHAPGFS